MVEFGNQRLTLAERRHARRIFEESLANIQQRYAPTEDVMVTAQMPNALGQTVIVARYKLYTDGRIECFEILDDVLWPTPD